MILIIDNYDSFTYNLYQQISAFGIETKVITHDIENLSLIEQYNPEKIIISPGPGTPENAGISVQVIKKYYSKIPILGVCLGHQALGMALKAKLKQAQNLLYGKTSKIYYKKSNLLNFGSSSLVAARYHSLVLETIPDGFEMTAWDEAGDIMAMEHTQYPLFGIQFHPESFMTRTGNRIINNFLNIK